MIANKEWIDTLGTRDDESVGPDGEIEYGDLEDRALPDGAARERERPGTESELHRRWREARVVLSLALFPGCPHVYVGQLARGVVWSLVFLFIVLPLSFFLFFTWAFNENALFWVLVGLGTFLVFGALGPTVHAFRDSAPHAGVRPSIGIAAYASVIVLAFAAESGWFLFNHLETVRVSSEFLEPLARQGDDTTILLSRYVRPVHGEVILFARSPDRAAREDDRRCLGRVIAKPGDAVSLEKGEVLVNGIRIDFERSDQRRRLEKAGRGIRRERFVTSLFGAEADLSAIRDRRVFLQGEDWTLVLPAGSYLVAPDVRLPIERSGETSPGEREPPSPSRVPVAWLVDRTAVVGRMIVGFW